VKQRPKDKSKQGYVNWPFMSVHTWGEMSKGRWKLIVTDLVNIFFCYFSLRRPNGTAQQQQQRFIIIMLLLQSSQNSSLLSGRIVNATLVLHGTSAMPEYRKNGARIYDDAFSRLSSRSVRIYIPL
jgi:hypothetical protein